MARYQKVGARRKETFHIPPRGTDQGNPAGQGLKRPNGRNAWERLDIGPARDMDRDSEPGKDLGHLIVWHPPGILDAGCCQFLTRLLGIPYAMHAGPQS